MAFLRQEYQSGLPFPDPGDLPESRIGSVFPALQVYFFLLLSHQESPFEGDNVSVIFLVQCVLTFSTLNVVAKYSKCISLYSLSNLK